MDGGLSGAVGAAGALWCCVGQLVPLPAASRVDEMPAQRDTDKVDKCV